jgi:ribosomal protein S2
MKLKSIKIKKYKLKRLYLMKYEVYKVSTNLKESLDDILDRIEIGLKKVLFIIHQYHFFNKTILFVGLPESRDEKLLKAFLTSRHIFIPSSMWERGLLGNKSSVSKKFETSVYFRRLLSVKNNPHLIVLFNESKLESILSECSKLSIPIIYLGSPLSNSKGISYTIEGNFKKKKISLFFQFLIYSIIKCKPFQF